MPASEWFHPDVFAVCCLGIGGVLMSLVEMKAHGNRPNRAWGMLAWGLVAVASLIAGAAYRFGQAPGIWLPPLLLASLGGTLCLIRLPAVADVSQRLWSLATRPSARWGAMVLAGPCAGLLWTCHVEQSCAPASEAPQEWVDCFDRSLLREIIPSPALTDAGRPIRIYGLREAAAPGPVFLEQERSTTQQQNFMQRLIKIAPADLSSNCFGWVFTGGHYWIRTSADVEMILQDNGYRSVSAARDGDVVAYRDAQARICHVGMVRIAEGDGLVLIESKWSWMGRYLHAPQDQCFGSDWTYYRSPRQQHLLRGLTGDSPGSVSATPPVQ